MGRPGALANEGWKDLPDPFAATTGRSSRPPIALAEVQGYVYDAWRRMARLARQRNEPRFAASLDRRAARLRTRFAQVFWQPDRGFAPMAIGRDGARANALASNIGQCLALGILEERHAELVAGRMLLRDMDPAGASGPWPLRNRHSIRSATTPARSGRMTRR